MLKKILLFLVLAFIITGCSTLSSDIANITSDNNLDDNDITNKVNEEDKPNDIDDIVPLIESNNKETVILFDPYNPIGWSTDLGRELEWSNEAKYITIEDFSVGDFNIGTPLEYFFSFLKSVDYIEIEEDIGYLFKTYITDNIILAFIKDINNDEPFVLWLLNIMNNEYLTTRGLRVGDNIEKVFELYGIPAYISTVDFSIFEFAKLYGIPLASDKLLELFEKSVSVDELAKLYGIPISAYKNGNIWEYNYEDTDYIRFKVVVVENIVQKIIISSGL